MDSKNVGIVKLGCQFPNFIQVFVRYAPDFSNELQKKREFHFYNDLC
jgi:hypothetical protein